MRRVCDMLLTTITGAFLAIIQSKDNIKSSKSKFVAQRSSVKAFAPTIAPQVYIHT